MKNNKTFRVILATLLSLTMLLPVAGAAIVPATAKMTNGTLNNFDETLIDGLMAPSEHATVNTDNSGGLRFATNINLEKYAALKAFCASRRINGLSVGTLIAPLDYVKEAGEFSVLALSQLSHETPFLDVKANTEIFYDGEKTVAEGYDEWFVASLMNVKLGNRNRDFAAIGYIQLTLLGGNKFYIYSYDNEDMALIEKYSANLAQTAAKSLEKEGWSEEEREMLTDFAAPEAVLPYTSAQISDMRLTRGELFFTLTGATKFYCRLTYDGVSGWRLQSNRKSYNHFRDIGAGQALSMYMRESFEDITASLTVTEQDGKLKISAKGTEGYALFSYNDFGIDFCSAAGDTLYNVNGFSQQTDGSVLMTGHMNATDGVYGGGERFDASNNRGKTMDMYIYDAYDTDKGKGTYVAVPLFSTSRGGGMFVNRYEPMSISFPKEGMAGDWRLTIDNSVLDCYFYATGNISDVLQSYTDMTGHASLPEEWAQGYLVCRFQPDFSNLNGTSGNADGITWFYNVTDIPNYSNYWYSTTIYRALTTDSLDKIANETKITNSDGSKTFYIFYKEGVTEDKNGNGKVGEKYFVSTDGQNRYYSALSELPNRSECHYASNERVRLSATAKLPHKKALTNEAGGTTYYHYIIETDGQDFNYNGIHDESYFLRTSTKGGSAGAGVIYVVESLIAAGMKPTGVMIEGFSWYDATTNYERLASLIEFVNYLDQHDIKTMLYSFLGYVNGSLMGAGYKDEYRLAADVYEYNTENGVIGERLGSTVNIPKADDTENPDTLSSGTQPYLDITNPKAVQWYMDSIWGKLVEYGIDGCKIDFCESVPNEGYYKNVQVGDHVGGYLKYRWYDDSVFVGDDVHNAYPSYFVSLFYKAMQEKKKELGDDSGFVVLTRGGGIGAQRNPYLWAGDQTRRFHNLKTQLAAVINSGISGIPFVSYDMSGYAYAGTPYNYYGGETDPRNWPSEAQGSFWLADLTAAEQYESEIFVRALQFTVFGNTIQTHGDVRHVYHMSKNAQEIAALYNGLHNDLAGYLRKMSQIACDTGMPMIRHMILEYQNDVNVVNVDDQFMYGDALLVAPILTCNTKTDGAGRVTLDYASVVTRTVYLPAGEWIDLNTRETIVSTGETIEVSANLAKIPVYLNTASEYAAELQEIFSGENWTAICALANAQ